ncbi:DUF2797 domain-containing protein [Halioglobus maricola]|uniref:DUF2797 domain-containing protein n=2 Tax=Halioglobus maricola TaxID=2601894 RepID=A0A5P9NQU8_9GAMM|nr:DUF2797 domain-containing protein [Halioglobus maricola]
MKTELAEQVQYKLPLGDTKLPMNDLLGKTLSLSYAGQINCIACDRKTNKSFSQGFCYPCFKRLAQCDSCIVSPEKCHYDAGTCREPAWGEENCLIDHIVYLSNTSGVKVGITRHSQVPTRWMDQGATQAQPIFRVSTRLQSGLVETAFKSHVADKTSWQAMLKGDAEPVDLEQRRQQLTADCAAELAQLRERYGLQAITELEGAEETRISYPVLEHPSKVKSFNLDKAPLVEGTLQGIKGQYLIFDTGVINMRKYAGYHLEVAQID